jgi:prepilin-type N-terminal cleavage/methylation domain-containing protein
MDSPPKSDRSSATTFPVGDGFTLIELLIVVLAMGVLAAIVAFAVGSFTSTSAVAACNTDVKTVENAVVAYEAQNNGSVPTSVGLLANTPGAGDAGGPYLHTLSANSLYYVISVTGGQTYVQLNSHDPAAKQFGYTTTGITTAVAFETFTWGGSTTITGQNVCAGA